MQEFRVPGITPRRFVEQVEQEIETRDFGEIAAVALQGDRLTVTFTWMGTSTLEYRLADEDGGFCARMIRRRMSPFHAPFKAGFDQRFEQVLNAVGAQRV